MSLVSRFGSTRTAGSGFSGSKEAAYEHLFAKGDKGNFLIATYSGKAKFSYPDEDGIFDGGVDLYADDAADELRKLFSELKRFGWLRDFEAVYCPEEQEIGEEVLEELERAELVFDDGEG